MSAKILFLFFSAATAPKRPTVLPDPYLFISGDRIVSKGKVYNMNDIHVKLKSVRFITEAAIIAGMYAALTIFFAPISSGQIQVRFAEALTILPFFTSAAVPGLFVGCLIANIFVGEGIYDIVLGPLATLLAAFMTWKMPSKYLAPLPPIIINAVYVGVLLYYIASLPIIATIGFVAIGETVACYALGYPLLLLLKKHSEKIFGHK